MNTQQKKISKKIRQILSVIILFSIAALMLVSYREANDGGRQDSESDSDSANDGGRQDSESDSDAAMVIRAFAEQNNLSVDEWPVELTELLEKNPDTKDFVLNYPLKKDLTPEIDLGEYKDSESVPLLIQWDERWGYGQYAGELMGLSGCGPTCLSMVCIYLLNNAAYTPKYVADFAEANGYAVSGNGSAWTLISEGGTQLGLDVTEIPLDENRIIRNLEAGNPIICVLGPGDFTTTGHFIVLTGYKDGMVTVNDPNSNSRSEKLFGETMIPMNLTMI